MPSLAQSHLHPAPGASSPGLAHLWLGKQKLRALSSAGLDGVGEPSPPSPSIGQAAGGEWPGSWSWAKSYIFTNKSDMKPVPLWVVWEKVHYVTEKGYIPLGLAW